jgi:hypothetical protein
MRGEELYMMKDQKSVILFAVCVCVCVCVCVFVSQQLRNGAHTKFVGYS